MLVMAVFVMLVLVMLVMAVFVMLVLVMIIMLIVGMSVKITTFAEIQLGQSMAVHQRHRDRVRGNAFNRFFKKCLEIVAHPKHDIGILELFCLRRLEGIGVRRSGPLDQKVGCCDPFHDS